MMDLLDYLAKGSDQPYRPELPAFEPHPLRRPDFTREFQALLTDKLAKKGVSLQERGQSGRLAVP